MQMPKEYGRRRSSDGGGNPVANHIVSPRGAPRRLFPTLACQATHTYDGHEAAGHGSFLAIAKEKIAAARRAEIIDEDALGAEAGVEQLRAIGLAEIEQNIFRWRLVAGRHHVEPLQGIRFVAGAEFVKPFGCIRKLRLELHCDFRANFVATAADGWTDGGEQVRGLATKMHLHLTGDFDHHAAKGSAPSGMNRGHGAFLRIHEKNWNTVRRLDPEQQTRAIRDGSVAAAGFNRGSIEELDRIGVKLLERDKREIVGAKSRLKPQAVFQDVFAGVPFGRAQI